MDDRYRGKDVHFCATCRWIEHRAPKTYVCTRLGYQTQPRWKFRCWTPRARYVSAEGKRDDPAGPKKDSR